MQTSSRKGRPALALQTLIDRITKKKVAGDIRTTEALDAARVLQQDPRTRVARYRNAALTYGTLNPVVRGIGRAAEHAVTAPRGARLAAGARGFFATNRGELAKHVTEGVVGGGAIRAVQEGLEVGQAKKKVTRFLNQPEPKVAEHEFCKEKAAAVRAPKTGPLSHLVSAHWRRKKAGLGEHLAQEVAALGSGRDFASIRTALGKVAAAAIQKKPAQSRLALKPVASPDLDFEV